MLKIQTIPGLRQGFDQRSYVLINEETKTAAVIDPDLNQAQIMKCVEESGASIQTILATHGHFDHIGSVKNLAEATGAKIAIHTLDASMLTKSADNLSLYFGQPEEQRAADVLLKDGDQVQVGSQELLVLHTPGHSPGSVCFLWNNLVFSGDTLFFQSMGNPSFPGGDVAQLKKSITEKLMVLPEHFRVLPGHGKQTTIGHEKAHNPFLGR